MNNKISNAGDMLNTLPSIAKDEIATSNKEEFLSKQGKKVYSLDEALTLYDDYINNEVIENINLEHNYVLIKTQIQLPFFTFLNIKEDSKVNVVSSTFIKASPDVKTTMTKGVEVYIDTQYEKVHGKRLEISSLSLSKLKMMYTELYNSTINPSLLHQALMATTVTANLYDAIPHIGIIAYK